MTLPRSLLSVVASCLLVSAVGAEPANPRWEKPITAIEAREAATPPPAGGILFTGSSSIRMWSSLAEDFPGKPVINRGFGGSQLSDLITYFDRVIMPARPSRIVVYSGTNDISAGEPVEQVFADLATLCGMIRRDLPETTIAVISCAPNPARWNQREKQETFNTLVTAYCARYGHDYIDVWTPMLGEDGTPSRDIYLEDRLHMNAAGYAIWREVVGPYLP